VVQRVLSVATGRENVAASAEEDFRQVVLGGRRGEVREAVVAIVQERAFFAAPHPTVGLYKNFSSSYIDFLYNKIFEYRIIRIRFNEIDD
jgi:hypothetical protein